MTDAQVTLRVSAYAKVNLGLEILGRRDDGFHEIVSVTQTISLHDTIYATDASGLAVTMDPPLVSAEENLIGRAARLLAEAAGRRATAHLAVRKRIPLAAGVGGGSSDAAATLRLLDRLWQTRLPPTRLAEIAAQLGSDVSLFLTGGAAVIRGRGEIVEPLPAPPPFWLALACPTFDVPDKTRAVYRALAPAEWTDGRATLELAERIRAGGSVLAAPLTNTFDGPAARVYAGFNDLRARLGEAAGAPIFLTGAGPSLFALFSTQVDAEAAAHRMRRLNIPIFVTRTVEGIPDFRKIQVAAP